MTWIQLTNGETKSIWVVKEKVVGISAPLDDTNPNTRRRYIYMNGRSFLIDDSPENLMKLGIGKRNYF
jgi:hypothetical protein